MVMPVLKQSANGRVSHYIRVFVRWRPLLHTLPLFWTKFRSVPFGVDCRSMTMMCGSAESEHPKLTNRKIIFEKSNVRDHN